MPNAHLILTYPYLSVGAQIARALSQQLSADDHSITLIEAREYYLHYPGALRMLVTAEGKLEDRVLIPYDKLFVNGNGKYVQGSVNSITHNGTAGGVVTTDSGVDYPYDVVVLASGSLWEGPLALPPTKEAAIAHVNNWREKFKNSKAVAIVGGGAVGAGMFFMLLTELPQPVNNIPSSRTCWRNQRYICSKLFSVCVWVRFLICITG